MSANQPQSPRPPILRPVRAKGGATRTVMYAGGGVLLVLLGIMGLRSCSNRMFTRTIQDGRGGSGGGKESTETKARLIGKWVNDRHDLQFTEGGTIIASDYVGRYSVTNDSIRITQDNVRGHIQYSMDFISDDELVLGEIHLDYSLGYSFNSLTGRWRRLPDALKPSATGEDPELRKFKQRREKLSAALAKRQDRRSEILAVFAENAVDSASAALKDERWKVLAQELRSVIEESSLLEKTISTIDSAVVRMESDARRTQSEKELKGLGFTDTDRSKLSQTIHELDEKLRTGSATTPIEDLELDAALQNEFKKPSAKAAAPPAATSLIGTWLESEGQGVVIGGTTIQFYADGAVTKRGTYSIHGNTIVIKDTDGVNRFGFQATGDSLKIIDSQRTFIMRRATNPDDLRIRTRPERSRAEWAQ